MGVESGAYNEQEKKNKDQKDKEKKDYEKKLLQQEKTKQYIETEVETEELLAHLHDMVDKGLISHQTVEHIIQGEDIEEEAIQEIFEKIDSIENTDDIDKYLPAELRVTKDEYSQAIHDDIFRVKTITKLHSSLVILSKQLTPDGVSGMNLFSSFLTILDKNLVRIQENTIDVKESLEEIHELKFPKVKKSLWERMKEVLIEIFN